MHILWAYKDRRRQQQRLPIIRRNLRHIQIFKVAEHSFGSL